MASLMSEIKITQEYRPCFVKGQKALFHRWEDKSEVIAPSILKGGHSGGTIRVTFGIIEREDGSIHECYPHEIVFVDNLIKQYAFKEEPNNAE